MSFFCKSICGKTFILPLKESINIIDAFNDSSFSEPFEKMLVEKYSYFNHLGKTPNYYLAKFFRFICEGRITTYLDLDYLRRINCTFVVETPYLSQYINYYSRIYLSVLDNLIDPRNRILPTIAIKMIANYLFINPNQFGNDDKVLCRIQNRDIRLEVINVLSHDNDYADILNNLAIIISKDELFNIEFKIIQLSNNGNNEKKLFDSNLIRLIRKKYFSK